MEQMIEDPKSPFDEITSDPSFLMILAGAAIWYIGYYIWFIGPLFVTAGFALVCFACAITALKRPVATAWPGMLLGGLVMIIGMYLSFLLFIGSLLYVVGAVMVIFFAIPLAVQRGELPVLTEIQKFWDKQSDARKKKAEAKTAVAEPNEATETDETGESEEEVGAERAPSDNYE